MILVSQSKQQDSGFFSAFLCWQFINQGFFPMPCSTCTTHTILWDALLREDQTRRIQRPGMRIENTKGNRRFSVRGCPTPVFADFTASTCRLRRSARKTKGILTRGSDDDMASDSSPSTWQPAWSTTSRASDHHQIVKSEMSVAVFSSLSALCVDRRLLCKRSLDPFSPFASISAKTYLNSVEKGYFCYNMSYFPRK
jgi:hypothetical protein